MPGLSSEQKKAKLACMSYAGYLSSLVKVEPQVVAMLDSQQKPVYGTDIDAISAQDAWGLSMLGFDGLKLTPSPGPGMDRDAIRSDEAEKYFFHFPDGNSSIARLLVRSQIPEAVPGNSVDDIVTARVRYGQLDQPNRHRHAFA
jgi:spermidine dehydrogenase